ncbi:MAG: hypothetical protein AAGJ53_08895, partial [Pseudomonadota bacterium]
EDQRRVIVLHLGHEHAVACLHDSRRQRIRIAEVQYNYTPLIFNEFITTNLQLEDTFYLKPRLSAMIDYTTSC